MDVDDATGRDVDDGLGQQQAIGHDDHEFRLQGAKLRLSLGRFQGFGLENRHIGLLRQLLHGAGHEFTATTRRPIGLRVDGANLMAAGQERL